MEIKKGDLVWLNNKKEKVKFVEKEGGHWSIHFWKPNWFQRFMYWTGIMKDPRYNGKKINYCLYDEVGKWNSGIVAMKEEFEKKPTTHPQSWGRA